MTSRDLAPAISLIITPTHQGETTLTQEGIEEVTGGHSVSRLEVHRKPQQRLWPALWKSANFFEVQLCQTDA